MGTHPYYKSIEVERKIVIPVVTSRKYKFVSIPVFSEEGEEKPIKHLEMNGRLPVRVSEAKVYTNLSPDTIKRYMDEGKLTRCEPNGTVRTEKKVGNNPLFFDLYEFSRLQF